MRKISFPSWRVSLRFFLLLFVPLCLWLAFLAARARQQRIGVELLRSGGCRIVYDYEKERTFKRLDPLLLPVPKWAIDAVGIDYFATVHSVIINDRPLTSKDVAALKRIPSLVVLVVKNGGEPPATLPSLHTLRKLQVVSFCHGTMTDDDLAWVFGLPELKRLEVIDTAVTDAWLAKIADDSPIEVLLLGKTRISDAGAAQLVKCRDLQLIDVGNSKITSAGVETLKEKFPDLRVLYGAALLY